METPDIEILQAYVTFYKGVAKAHKTAFLDTLNSLEKYFTEVSDEELVKERETILGLIQMVKFNAMALQDEPVVN